MTPLPNLTTDRETARQSRNEAAREIEREVRAANLPRLMAIAATIQQAIARK